MPNGKDYYAILGIPRNAKEDEIKQAYRKLAREHHPDVVKDGDKTAAEKRFKEINEAYQVLSDPQKRQIYDQYGHVGSGFAGAGAQDPFGGAGQGRWGPFTYTYTGSGQGKDYSDYFGDFDPFDVFEEFFGFRGFGRRKAPRKGKNLYYEMAVDFVDAVRGAERTVRVESGDVTIKIPPGVRDGTEMRFPGKGMPGPSGTPAGDLYITIRIPTPRDFRRVGSDLGVLVHLDFSQLILGDEVEVPVVDPDKTTGVGKAKLRIPPGTQPGTQFRVRGKGMPNMRGGGRGDVIVTVGVTIPKRLSRRQKQLLEEYRRSG
jgi:DnaJ-class molecular chaperone